MKRIDNVSSLSAAVVSTGGNGAVELEEDMENKKVGEDASSSQDDVEFKFKQNGNNGDVSATGTKRCSTDPLASVMSKCPKLLSDR